MAMGSFRGKIQDQLKQTDTLQRLLIANIAIFLFIRIVNSISYLFVTPVFNFRDVADWLAVPSNIGVLAFKPWTLVTYMFFHWEFMHVLFNMLWLFWMGRILNEYLGSKKLLAVYFLGGLTGGVFYIAAYNIFPLFAEAVASSFALGASASVLAITVAAATLVPNYTIQLLFFGSVKLKWIALLSILLDLISVSGSNAGGHIAHLGGAVFGFVYIRRLKAGQDLGAWFTKLTDRLFRKSSRMKIAHDRRSRSDEEFIIRKKARQEMMDDILDKISRSGYGSLTQAEKDFLFQMSKEE